MFAEFHGARGAARDGEARVSQGWLKFYPSDWRADPALRMCSLAARGLWMEMLCVMHEAEPRGFLLVNGRSLSTAHLAALAGCSTREAGRLVDELESAGVFSRDGEGVIFSRRILKDIARAERDRLNGKRGGNPNIKAGVNPPDKAQKPEARYQRPDNTAASSARENFDRIERDLREAAGCQQSPHPGLMVLAPILGLIDGGADLQDEILPAIRAKPKPDASSWAYFVPQIQEFRAKRQAARSMPLPEVKTVSGKPDLIALSRAATAGISGS